MCQNCDHKKTSHGLGIAALAAAIGAGVYYLYGSKRAEENRAQLKGWMHKAKSEVHEKMEQYHNLKETDYHRIIDAVTEKYKKLKDVNSQEVEDLAKELKAEWKNIKKDATVGSGTKTRKTRSTKSSRSSSS